MTDCKSDLSAVLIREDDPEAAPDLRDALKLDRFHKESLASKRDASRVRHLGGCLAMLLDCSLPDGSGDGLLPHLRDAAPEAPVILITGCAGVEGEVTALRQGAVGSFPKPVDPELLRLRQMWISGERHQRDELAGQPATLHGQVLHADRVMW